MIPDPAPVAFAPSDACRRYVARNAARFQKLVARAQRPSSLDRQALRCMQAAAFAVRHACGTVYSGEIEATLQKLARALHPVDDEGTEGILHVMTRAYGTGGHTRVVERWLRARPNQEPQDVVLCAQGGRAIPPSLRDHARAIEVLRETSPMKRAQELRQLAAGYRAVILHIHPQDPLAVIAFGPGFCRPVMTYNHADHLFWLGSSVTDLLINFRSHVQSFNAVARHAGAQAVLPLPVAEPLLSENVDRIALRRGLSIADDAFVLITVAASYKYRPFAGLDFCAAAERVIQQCPNVLLLAIGPTRHERRWRRAHCATQGRIRALGCVSPERLQMFFHIADLALESFPLGSTLSLLDAAGQGLPCVALRTPANPIDQYEEANILADGADDWMKRVTALMNVPRASTLQRIVARDCAPAGFARHLTVLTKLFPPAHTVRDPLPTPVRTPTSFEWYMAESQLAQRNFCRCLSDGVRAVIRGVVSYGPLCLMRVLYPRLSPYGLL